MSEMVKVVVDVMGGDNAPEEPVKAAVEAVKEKLKDPKYKDITLMGVADECGFNSKTSFYRVFKEVTGITPADYLEQLKNKR